MKTIILASGRGTRLRPLTYYLPKPMLPVDEKPVLEHIIEYLKGHRMKDIIITVSHLGEQIENYFDDGSRFGVNIEYSRSKEPQGTAGEVFAAKDLLKGDSFVVYYGDTLTDMDLKKMVELHKKKKTIATLFGVKGVPVEFGVIEEENGFVKEIKEKPKLPFLVNCPVFVLSKKALEYLGPGLDFSKDVFPKMLSSEERISLYKEEGVKYYDVGRLSDYERIREEFNGG